jgi:hypothetical protein
MGLMDRQTLGLAIVMVLAWFGAGTAANAPPRAGVLAVDVIAGVPAGFVLPGSDEDGAPLTYTVLGGPDHGHLEGVPPYLTYVPAAGFQGTDQFTYAVRDPSGALDVGMVRLRVVSQVTTHRIGQSHASVEAGLAGLAAHLAHQQVSVWYIFAERTVVFAVGQPIPVLLPPGGAVSWAGLSQIAEAGQIALVASDWDPKGWLRVITQALSPGSYILTVVKDHQAFSFLVTLRDTPPPGPHLAVNEPREVRGG